MQQQKHDESLDEWSVLLHAGFPAAWSPSSWEQKIWILTSGLFLSRLSTPCCKKPVLKPERGIEVSESFEISYLLLEVKRCWRLSRWICFEFLLPPIDPLVFFRWFSRFFQSCSYARKTTQTSSCNDCVEIHQAAQNKRYLVQTRPDCQWHCHISSSYTFL